MKYTWYHRYRVINQITWGPPLQLHWKPDSKARRRKLKCCDITWALSRLWLCSIFSISTEIYFISINYYKCIGSCSFQSWLFLCINKLLRQTEQKLRIFTSFIIETPKTCQPCFATLHFDSYTCIKNLNVKIIFHYNSLYTQMCVEILNWIFVKLKLRWHKKRNLSVHYDNVLLPMRTHLVNLLICLLQCFILLFI